MRVLGVADSDSYLKWGAAMLQRMPADWSTDLVVLRTPALPTEAQRAAALAGTPLPGPPLLQLAEVATLIGQQRPDVVFLALRGPVIRVLVRAIIALGDPRPVLVTGLPGISIPASLNAIYYRSQADVLVLHSKREVAEFTALAAGLGVSQRFALATLPFLPARRASARRGTDVVFAAQAKVPAAEADRRHLLDRLMETALANPELRVVIKLRGVQGEAQTHHERYPYDALLREIEGVPGNVVVETGPMSEALRDASALVTVSSTAAIEAIATGVPVVLIDDFGVSPQLINSVFEGSGLLAPLDDVVAGSFRSPEEHWLDENYFHAPTEDDWIGSIEQAVAARDAGQLSLRPQFRGRFGGTLRRVWDRRIALGEYDTSVVGTVAVAIGWPLRELVRFGRRVRSRAAARRELVRSP